MRSVRMALWVWYRGSHFVGFQRQGALPTVQASLEDAFEACGHAVRVMPAGRTDRGVHARMQVVSLRLPAGTPPERVIAQAARRLPADLGIARWAAAPNGFHAQWSAAGKEYRYRLTTAAADRWEAFAWAPAQAPTLAGRTIDWDLVARALEDAVGTRDFIAFHEKSSVRKPRTLSRAQLLAREDGLWEVRLAGDSFARYQVRYLVGSAVAVGAGLLSQAAFRDALETGQTIPGLRAPGHGLTLWEVHYPAALDPFAKVRADEAGLPPGPPF